MQLRPHHRSRRHQGGPEPASCRPGGVPAGIHHHGPAPVTARWAHGRPLPFLLVAQLPEASDSGIAVGVAIVAGLLAVGIWVWQRRQVMRLRFSEVRFRALIDNAFDASAIVGVDGSLKFIHFGGLRMPDVRAKASPAAGEPFARLVHPEDLRTVEAAHARLMDRPDGSSDLWSFRMTLPDGTSRTMEAMGTNCLRMEGIEGLLVNLRDITARQSTEEQWKKAELINRRIAAFAASLTPHRSEEDILWEITRQCISVLGFDDCVIYLIDTARGNLVQKAAHGPKNPGENHILAPIQIPIGRGIVGAVAASGRPELIADTSTDPRYIVDDAPRLSEIAVPIVAGNRVLGVIDSEHPQRGFFTEEHLTVLISIAALCANKLEWARAERELRESQALLEVRIADRTRELVAVNNQLRREISERSRAEKVQRALYSISEAIHAVSDLPSLYARLHEIISTLMPAKNFYIALHDAETDMVSFPYHRDEMDPPPPPRKGRRGITEYVLRSGRATLADLHEINRLKENGEYDQTGAPAKIWLGVPLASGRRPFGVMALQDHHNERVYGEEEKQILSFVAGQTALAIERKRAEHELRVALAAEKELNQLKSSFVSMVSHEFRTPLEVILSSSNILDRYLDRLPPDKRSAQLRAIRKSVHRMNDLIEDVLVLGKFDAGRMNCQPLPLDLPAFCRRAIAEVETAARREGIIQFVARQLPADIQADESLLHHILTNLLSNAVKYSPPGSAVRFTVTPEESAVVFTVADTGCGIPAADLNRIFTAFYRGSNVEQTAGIGLGLVIVKRCVDLHGGTIACESAEGRGTTFRVSLPLVPGTGDESPVPHRIPEQSDAAVTAEKG